MLKKINNTNYLDYFSFFPTERISLSINSTRSVVPFSNALFNASVIFVLVFITSVSSLEE